MCQLEVRPNLFSDSDTIQRPEVVGKSQPKRESCEEQCQHGQSIPTLRTWGVQTVAAQKFGHLLVHDPSKDEELKCFKRMSKEKLTNEKWGGGGF